MVRLRALVSNNCLDNVSACQKDQLIGAEFLSKDWSKFFASLITVLMEAAWTLESGPIEAAKRLLLVAMSWYGLIADRAMLALFLTE